jgi:hypothetical protein
LIQHVIRQAEYEIGIRSRSTPGRAIRRGRRRVGRRVRVADRLGPGHGRRRGRHRPGRVLGPGTVRGTLDRLLGLVLIPRSCSRNNSEAGSAPRTPGLDMPEPGSPLSGTGGKLPALHRGDLGSHTN